MNTSSIVDFFVVAIVFSASLTLLLVFSRRVFCNMHRWIQYVLLAFSLFQFGGGTTGSDSSTVRQVLWGGVFVLSFIRLSYHDGAFRIPALSIPLEVYALIGYLCISVIWSPMPGASIKRIAQIAGVLIVGCMVSHETRGDSGMATSFILPSFIIVAIGVLLAAVAPGIAFDGDHSLRAMTSHKNTWGQFSLLASLIFLWNILNGTKYRSLLLWMLALTCASLFLSRSATGVVTFMVSGTVMIYATLAVKRSRISNVGIVLATAAVVILLSGYGIITGESPFSALYEAVFSGTGKHHTLTGRTYLWNLMLAEAEKHLVFGIGYGGFWNGMLGPSASVIQFLNWGPPTQAHNGYIDVVNEIGVVGWCIFGIVLARHGMRIAALARAGLGSSAVFHGVLLFTALIINYTESSFLRTTHVWWIFLSLSIIEVYHRYSHVKLSLPVRLRVRTDHRERSTPLEQGAG